RTARDRGQARRRVIRRSDRLRRLVRPRARGVRGRPLSVAADRAGANARAQGPEAQAGALVGPGGARGRGRRARLGAPAVPVFRIRGRGRSGPARREPDGLGRGRRLAPARIGTEGARRAHARRRPGRGAARRALDRDRCDPAGRGRLMAAGRSDTRLRPSLLDRLILPQAWDRGDRTRTIGVNELRDSVQRDLGWLLNTYCPLSGQLDGLPEAQNSTLSYGLS